MQPSCTSGLADRQTHAQDTGSTLKTEEENSSEK